MRHLGFVVIKNGAFQTAYNYPRMIEHARKLATDHAERLAANNAFDACGNVGSVKVVETYDDPGHQNALGETVAEWIGTQRVVKLTGDNARGFHQTSV